ncbi:MAG: rRNA maturation RNase YbeY [Scytonema sp. PMC 1069.18]|nr:rRNA maturation RNase YbeY [Scytonema sp. PMC 1069.18]MEC4880137.1 rRNA maturation RNase YbeY [Scytonema sp. PMC 1070.18]
MQVELYVQDCYVDSYQQSTVFWNACTQISTETWEHWFQHWLELLHDSIPSAPVYELGLRLTDDSEIQVLNSQYRNQNKATDVLSFAALEVEVPQPEDVDSETPLYLGDIVISIETAQRQAQKQEHSLKTELAWLAAHGLLHLLGWDHPDEDSLSRMLNKQVILLKNISIDIDLE